MKIVVCYDGKALRKVKEMKINERPEYGSKPKPLTFSKNTKVSEAVKAMSQYNYGAVVVVNDDNTIAGIVSERDLMTRLINDKKNPETTELSEIMTTEVRTAKEDDLVVDWLRIMSNERFRHLPIINENKHIVNLMSQGDFVSYTWPELLRDLKNKAYETWGIGHQVILIFLAILAYALTVQIFV